MSKKILITDYLFDDISIEEKIINDAGYELIINKHSDSVEDLIEAAKDASAILTETMSFDRNIISQLTKCECIVRYGVGVDLIDVAAASEKNIRVINIPNYCVEEVSDHVIALMFSAGRRIVELNSKTKNCEWNYDSVKPIQRFAKQTVGLVGFGNIAQRVAHKAMALGMNVITYDPYVSEDFAREKGVRAVDFNELQKCSDYISIHVPLNSNTEKMFDVEQFDMMKDSAVIINTARGKIINETALVDAIKNNKIRAAALDTLENEPLTNNNPLKELDNVILTPHCAYYSEDSIRELHRKAATYAIKALNNEVFPEIINQKALVGNNKLTV